MKAITPEGPERETPWHMANMLLASLACSGWLFTVGLAEHTLFCTFLDRLPWRFLFPTLEMAVRG
jgi:hypothetical protein